MEEPTTVLNETSISVTSVNQLDTVVNDYTEAEQAVVSAEKALEEAKAKKEELKLSAQEKLKVLKTLLENNDGSVYTTEVVSAVVETKLEEAKDTWAELAKTDPDEARRQLRKFWIIVAGSAGIILGILIEKVFSFLF